MSVVAFPLYKITDIPESLRQLANRIECGEITAERVVVAIEPGNAPCTYVAFGSEPFTRGHAAGLLSAAAHKLLAEMTE